MYYKMLTIHNVFLYALFVPIIVINCNGENYCSSEYCDNTKQHTLCKFKTRDPARHCIDYELIVKNEKDKLAILDKINSRRNKVASGEIRSFSPAANMNRLAWNTELEMSAQVWANQCVKHGVPDIEDSCRDLGKVLVGQNIATVFGESPGLSAATLVDVWYMELLHTNSSVISKYMASADIGHPHYDYFTQLIWAESTEVGCGGVKFKELLKDNGKINRTIFRLVCNFAPGGNRYNKTVYLDGMPCTKCAGGDVCDPEYRALCRSTLRDTVRTAMDMTQDLTEIVLLTSSSIDYGKTNDNIKTVEVMLPTSMEFENTEEEYNMLTPLDYFSLVHDFTIEQTSTSSTTAKPDECKDAMIVDDFVDLLKKKIINDPVLKTLLLPGNLSVESTNSDNAFTDSNVEAFIHRIYSRKDPITTVKTSYSDYLNSTLLVDLVEAVIFRRGDKIPPSKELYYTTQSMMEVNPIKIQAELAEVKPNQDFTGHYFFPEDETEEASSEATEEYYDSSNILATDIVLEIEDLMKGSATQDFLDEILESEVVTESTTTQKILSPDDMKLYKEGYKAMHKFLKDIEDQTRAKTNE